VQLEPWCARRPLEQRLPARHLHQRTHNRADHGASERGEGNRDSREAAQIVARRLSPALRGIVACPQGTTQRSQHSACDEAAESVSRAASWPIALHVPDLHHGHGVIKRLVVGSDREAVPRLTNNETRQPLAIRLDAHT